MEMTMINHSPPSDRTVLSSTQGKSVSSPKLNSNPNKHPRLSQEEIEAAADVSLLDFLPSVGQPLKQTGRSHRWTGSGNDSIAIIPHAPHLFKHFATGESGNAITFCQKYLGMTFVDAVVALNRGRFVDVFPNKNGAGALYSDIQGFRDKK